MSPVLFVLLAVMLVILVCGGYIFTVACRRRKEVPWLVEEEINKTPYAKYYKYISTADKWLKTHQAQDVYIRSRDGLRLHGLWVPADDPKGTMLLVHGYRSTMLVDFSLMFDFYHGLGMNLLIPDQRSHGKSEGKYITFGVKESGDMLGWLAFHNRQYGPYPLILCGLSMGASTVLYMADESLPDNVRGIIADCGFTSPKAIIGQVYGKVTHLPGTLPLLAADLFARVFAGFSLTQKDTRKTMEKDTLPVLLVHGLDDGFVPSWMTQQSYDACRGPKQLLLVEGAEHGMSFYMDRARYASAVIEFLKDHVEDFA